MSHREDEKERREEEMDFPTIVNDICIKYSQYMKQTEESLSCYHFSFYYFGSSVISHTLSVFGSYYSFFIFLFINLI